MVSARDFVDGLSIRWRRLATVLFGGTLLAYFEGIAATLLSFANWILGLLDGFATFLGLVVEALTGPWIRWVDVVWQGSAAFVANAGIAGYIVGLGIVLLTIYVAVVVLDYA